MSVKVYVEGGGRAELNEQCRLGFQKLLIKAGFGGRLPRVVSCGSRERAFRSFSNALHESGRSGEYPILLVDSEDIVADANLPGANPSGAWTHLSRSDGWERPAGVEDDQAQLMVTTMETWLLADRQRFIAYFPGINRNALPADSDLESRSKQDVADALGNATQSSSKGPYHKGNHSFDLLGEVNPAELRRRLPHFLRFVEALESRLPAS